MRKVQVGDQLKMAFDSVPELARWIEQTPRQWREHQSQTTKPSTNWDLNCGFVEAVCNASRGWNKGAQRAAEQLRILPLRSAAPDTRTDFYGHMPHVPRYCAGAPDSMVRHARDAQTGSGKVLTLYVPINAPCYTRADSLSNLGLAIAQYINQLETDGYRVELHGGSSSQFNKVRGTTTWRIKTANQPLDLAVMSFAIGHPAMFRRLDFAVYERSGVPETPGYGRSETMTLDNLIDPPAGSYIVNGMKIADSVARTPESALAYVTKQLDAMLSVSDAREAA